jgi:hypothetical protein
MLHHNGCCNTTMNAATHENRGDSDSWSHQTMQAALRLVAGNALNSQAGDQAHETLMTKPRLLDQQPRQTQNSWHSTMCPAQSDGGPPTMPGGPAYPEMTVVTSTVQHNSGASLLRTTHSTNSTTHSTNSTSAYPSCCAGAPAGFGLD